MIRQAPDLLVLAAEQQLNRLHAAGVKDAVLQAVDELYIADLPPSHAAEKLMDLAMGASLGKSLPHRQHEIALKVHHKSTRACLTSLRRQAVSTSQRMSYVV